VGRSAYLRCMGRNREANDAAPSGSGRVLVVGTDTWAVEQASATLSAAGLTIVNCHPVGEPAFPCNALVAGRECPLERGFDVVVTVRARPLDAPTPGEMGVVCGLHADAALVSAGMSWRNPFAAWATRTVHDDMDLVAVVCGLLADIANGREKETVNLTETAGPPAVLDLS